MQIETLNGSVREAQNPEIIDALGEAVRRHGVKELAKKIRKSPSQLYAELNIYGDQSKAKLSLDDAIELARLTNEVTWLAMIAGELGYHLIPKHADPDKDCVLAELCDDAEMHAKFSEIVRRANVSEAEIRAASAEARREIRETEALAIKKLREKRVEQ